MNGSLTRRFTGAAALTTALLALPAQAGVTLPNRGGTCPEPVDTETGEPNCSAVLETSAGLVPVKYEVLRGKVVVEGDMTVPAASVRTGGGVSTEAVGVGSAVRRFQMGNLWPRGIVYYRYDASVGAALKATIQQAITHYHQRTSLIFVEDTANVQTSYVRYISPAGSTTCNSDVGYPGPGKIVTTELGAGCNSFDVVIHETGHAIGLKHEHTRADRDNFINIDFANLKPGKAGNFTKWDVREGILTDYDFDSVMHYNSMVSDTSFVYDTTKPVFTRKNGSLIVAQDGQGLSDGDVRGIDEMYGNEVEPVAPAVAWSNDRLDVFVRGTDGGLFHKAWTGSYWYPGNTFEALGGYMLGSPEVVSWGKDRLDVFVRGGDRGIYHKAWDGSGWYPSATGWENLGGRAASHPSVASWGPNRLDLFVKGDDGQIFHKAWNGSSWGGYEALGGYSLGAVKAVSWGPNRLDIFTVGLDRALYHKAWDGHNWYPSQTGWENLGGIVYGQPSVVSWGEGRLDIFVKGQNGGVYHKAWDNAWFPSVAGWEDLGGRIIGSPQAVSWGPNRLDIVVQGTDGQVFQKAWAGSSWQPSLGGWAPLGGGIIGSPSIVSWGPNRLDIFARGMDDGLYHKAWGGSSWYPSATGWENHGGRIGW